MSNYFKAELRHLIAKFSLIASESNATFHRFKRMTKRDKESEEILITAETERDVYNNVVEKLNDLIEEFGDEIK